MSDFWTPGMSACTSIAFCFCGSTAPREFRAPHRLTTWGYGLAVTMR